MAANGEGNKANAVGRQYAFKEIYLITNNINGKKYIGQSINSKRRFSQHKAMAGKDSHSLLHMAMQKYGIENFSIIILEQNCKNYNEREKYWIKNYNTLAPNGYNLLPGGSSLFYPDKAKKRKYSEEDFYHIVEDIQNRSLSWNTIARKWKTCESQIRNINFGTIYFHEDIEYPIRENSHLWGVFQSLEEIKKVHEEILETNSFCQLAKKYNCTETVIQKINLGKIKNYRLPEYTYPLVKEKKPMPLDKKTLRALVKELSSSDLTLAEIAIKFNLSYSQVRNFNAGLYYKQEGVEYPIKKELEHFKYTPQIIEEIQRYLFEGKTNSEIQKIFPSSSNNVISRINNGKPPYFKSGIKYPIRLKNSSINRATLELIQNELEQEKTSFREIAKKFNVKIELIHHINNGSKKSYFDESKKYPLRAY